MDRRDAIRTLSLGTLAVSYVVTGCETPVKPNNPFGEHVSEEDLKKWNKQFFTDHEFATVTALADMVIPADERSGNAEEAGVPEFIDFMMLDKPRNQTPIRGGLHWVDARCNEFFGRDFINCTEEEKKEMLDKIAYPEIAEPEMEPGVNFFNRFRDLVASGFWTSKMGIEDINYMGNKATQWDGCSREALDHLGVSYDKS